MTFLAYCLLSVTLLLAARRSPEPERRIATALAVGVLTLGFVVAVGLSGALVEQVRGVAGSEGWYDDRRPIQTGVILASVVAVTSAGFAVWIKTRWAPWTFRAILEGASLLFCFLFVRAISLHQVDAYLSHRVEPGPSVGLIAELTIVGLLVMLSLKHRSGH